MLSTDTMIVHFVVSIYTNITTQCVVYWFTVIKIMDGNFQLEIASGLETSGYKQ